jgi:hypothetical protein
MRRDALEPQLPHLGVRPDEPLPFPRTTGREDDPFPDGYAFGLVFRLFRGAAGGVGEAFLFCAGVEVKVSDSAIKPRYPSETDSKDVENAKRSNVPADLDSSIIFFHLSKCA